MKRQRSRQVRIRSVAVPVIAVLAVLMGLTATAQAQNPVPFVDQPLVPDATAPGGPAFTLTVNGSGFLPTSTVNWNGSPRTTTFATSSRLTATILASDIAKASTAAVTVVNSTPGGGLSNTQFFSITAASVSVSFLPAVTYDSGGDGANAVAVADLNGDGRLDLVVANASGVAVLLGNGDGTFHRPVSYSLAGGTANSISIGDLNGDGYLDLAVASYYSSSVFVLLGNGDGTFKTPIGYKTGGFLSTSVAIADLNGDGHPDLVLTDVCQYSFSCNFGIVSVLLGKGNGTFYPAVVYRTGGYYATSVAISDVNGDGKLDLVVTDMCVIYDTECTAFFSGPVSVMLGNGDGTFHDPVGYGTGGEFPVSVAVADLNGDGHPDLAVVNEDDEVGVLLGNGDGTFRSAASYASGGFGATSVAIGDLNGDGKMDLAVSNDFNNPTSFGLGTVGILLGNGDGTFQPAASFQTAEYLSDSVAIADVNGNGKPDLLVADYCEGVKGNCSGSTLTGTVGVFLNKSVAATTTAISSSLNPSIYGQSITWTAKVTTTGSSTPTGTVNFSWDGYSIGRATLNSSGVATLTKSNLNAYTYPLIAVYSGDANNAGSTSAILNQVVKETTSTATLSSSPNPSTDGQSVTFTATITSQTVVPTGPVTFTAGTTLLGTVQISDGKAIFSTSTLPVGSTVIKATYSGDSNIVGSSASITQTVEE